MHKDSTTVQRRCPAFYKLINNIVLLRNYFTKIFTKYQIDQIKVYKRRKKN